MPIPLEGKRPDKRPAPAHSTPHKATNKAQAALYREKKTCASYQRRATEASAKSRRRTRELAAWGQDG